MTSVASELNNESIFGLKSVNEMNVIFYQTADGSEPVKDFLLALDEKMRAKVIRTIQLLEANGFKLREPFSKHLDDGIFELRIQIATDITRVLYFFFIGDKAVLTNGFKKKTNKTPPQEIEKAKLYRLDFIKRQENK